MSMTKCCAIIAVLLATLLSGSERALDPTQSIDQVRHSQWTLKDGAPGNVRALAQGRDGFLWLGSSTGLYRFDGMRFDRILPDQDDPRRSLQVTALLTAHNGDIWVGYDFGGIAIYRNGHLRDANPWRPQGGVASIVQARDGAIWITAESRGKMLLSRFGEGHWTRFGPQDGLTDGMMGPLLAASDGSIYVALPPALLRLKPKAKRFERLPDRVAPFAALAEDRDTHIWLADEQGIRMIGQNARAAPLASVDTPYVTRHLYVDRNNGLWITGQSGGLIHRRAGDTRMETGRRHDGIPAPLSLSALEDREGNMWIGTETGIDRLASASIVHAPSHDSIVTGFVSPPDKPYVYVAGLAGIYKTGAGQDAPKLIFRQSDIGVLCGDARRLLAISLSGIFLLDLDDRGDVRRSMPVQGPLSVSCALDAQGQFWTGMDRLYRLSGQQLVAANGSAGQPGGTITLLRPDSDHGLIAARSGQGLLHIRDGMETPIIVGGASSIGSISTLTQIGDRLLVGGQKGIAAIDKGRIMPLSERAYPYFAGATAIYRAPDGWTWINGATGIVRMRNADLEKGFAHPGQPIAYQRIGHEADYRARSNLFDANDIASDATGRLWFATDRGLAWSEPHRLARNAMPPPVIIRSLRVDGVSYPLDAGSLQLPAHSRRVQIEYTALSLTDANQNRFRYRLNGTGAGWFDAGGERQALFTNLGPGTYRFQVLAANNDGAWNRHGASLSFTIAPAFYQTRWFFCLCIAAILAAGWLLYRRRLQVVSDRARGRVEAQLMERERIARELHDTLLQGFQGLMLRFQAVVELLPKGDRPRKELENTLDRAEDILIESRERVHSLRQELEPVALADRLRQVMEDVIGYQIDWRIEEEGNVRLVCAPVADEMARIAREAFSNSLRHAFARSIRVQLHHGTDRISLTILDDGIGLPAEVIERGGREGHYGIVGMRERARRLQGRLEITSSVSEGTMILITIPSRIAYL